MACGWGTPFAAALLLAAVLSVSHAQKTEVVLILGDGCAAARMATHPCSYLGSQTCPLQLSPQAVRHREHIHSDGLKGCQPGAQP
jgi:hypothetical protein